MKDQTEEMRADALTLLRTIDATRAHGQSGARVDPPRAAQDVGMEVGSGGTSAPWLRARPLHPACPAIAA